MFWRILCRDTVFTTLKHDQNSSEVFGNSVKKHWFKSLMRARRPLQNGAMSSVISKAIIKWVNPQKREHCIYLRSKTIKWLSLTCPFRFLFPKILINRSRGQGNKTSSNTAWYLYTFCALFVLKAPLDNKLRHWTLRISSEQWTTYISWKLNHLCLGLSSCNICRGPW